MEKNDFFFIVSSYLYLPGYFTLYTKSVDWNGQQFEHNNQAFSICQFSGTKNITDRLAHISVSLPSFLKFGNRTSYREGKEVPGIARNPLQGLP